MKKIDELFVDAFKILEQNEREDRFRGKILSNFAKIEQIITMIIRFHNSKISSQSTELTYSRMLNTGWKLKELEKIFQNKIYQNRGVDFRAELKNIEECRQLRNQLAHNIVYPGSSEENVKKGNKNITMIFFESHGWKKKDFSEKEQEKLDGMVYRTYRSTREMYRFVVQSHGDHSTLAF